MQLHRDRERFEAAGVELVAIGNGSVEQAAEFVQRVGVEGLRLLVDPEREVYRAAGAKVGTIGELIGRRVVRSRAAREARVEGARQGGIVGHPAQLGGVLIVATDGSVPYAHLAKNAADIPPNHKVLAAARAASGLDGAGPIAKVVKRRGVEQSGSSSGS